jgi:hypothetical protein
MSTFVVQWTKGRTREGLDGQGGPLTTRGELSPSASGV